ncbi:MAG: DNA cytosine methyltransferase [Oscillospiraceae bacterium]|nr:DNA cytosine methyltransferase [Oscillospiraceae bacterium]
MKKIIFAVFIWILIMSAGIVGYIAAEKTEMELLETLKLIGICGGVLLWALFEIMLHKKPKEIIPVNHFGVVTPTLIQYHDEQGKNEVRGQSLVKPLLTADAANRYALAAATLIQTGYGEAPGQQPRAPGIDKPLGTVVSTSKHAVITSHLDIFRNNEDGQSNSEPLKTIMTNQHFGEVRCFLTKAKCINDIHKWGKVKEFLNSYCGYSIADDEILLFEISGVYYFISDIGLRMLTPRELFNAQGFPSDYIIDIDHKGNVMSKSAQVARCGNAVPPPFAEALVRANLPELCGKKIKTMKELEEVLAV